MPRKQEDKTQAERRNAVIYARFSSHRQREESIEQQVSECREYADKNNVGVQSGTTLRKRGTIACTTFVFAIVPLYVTSCRLCGLLYWLSWVIHSPQASLQCL